MSINLTKPVCGVVIGGTQMDTRPQTLLNEPEKGGVVKTDVEISKDATRPSRQYKKDTDGYSVSGKKWKKLGTQASNCQTFGPEISLEEKKKRQAHLKMVREFVKIRKKEINEKLERARLHRRKKKERKEENVLKGQTYQMIKNTKKIRKWSKKARKRLIKMPKEMFEKYLLKHKHENTYHSNV